MRLLVLLAVIMAQPRRINLHAQPWTHVLDTMSNHGADAARHELESLGDAPHAPDERAFALRWAGQLALRERHVADAQRDFHAAMASDPGGIDARWAALGTVDVALVTHTWPTAERTLAPLVHDRDPGIRMYALNRERQIRAHFRDGTVRVAASVAALLGWALALTLAWRRRRGFAARFGRALLVTETLALTATAAVNHYATPLARPGWMAGAIPGAVLAALAFAAVPQGAVRRLGLTVTMALASAGMVYLALDYTWWSVH